MVKFTKNGSTAVSAAVKLSRAYTGREIVARCEQHPFFSYDDWFIGSTPITRGVPKETINNTKTFKYNDINSLQSLIDEFPNQIACVVLEPATTECPAVGDFKDSCCGKLECDRMNTSSGRNFLQEVENLCNKNGIVFVLDEMITGFRWSKHGAQDLYGVTPDLSTFGKAMANGYAVACLAGKREIMELGAIDSPGEERVFLLSTTHGAEATSLSAFVETVKFISENNVIDHFWQYGFKLVSAMNEIARSYGIQNYFKAAGPSCSPYYLTLDNKGLNSLPLRTLFSQEMFKNGVSMPWIAIAYRHQNVELQKTINALEESLRIVAKATEVGVEKFLNGPAIKPVFRKFN
jgi:glutamate-1-semialdehyde 2,1-aminomutase